ncbi:hypothetical protein TrST_g12549 [Triparma strigata]|uniref:BTB domain-containing protein n=1 Tax=Triparma strigata TaxID=1606541 RepID=A0A9W7EIL4_9STRA|nr:hypothetical protein TrST_g12549 [Triparma strigata]
MSSTPPAKPSINEELGQQRPSQNKRGKKVTYSEYTTDMAVGALSGPKGHRSRTQQGGSKEVKADENVNFRVVAKSNLYLTGSERSLLRVKSGNVYSCLMTTSQKMSSLFRHYAKYHGLRKEGLVFTYTDVLKGSDTPNVVGLKKDEEIWVREKEVCETGSPQIGVITEKANKSWNDDMKNNIRSAAPDVYFLVGEARIGAHQAVVAARGGSDTILKGPKTKDGDVVIGVNSEYTVEAIKVILEFIYTASVQGVLDLAKRLAGTPIALASILTEAIELSKLWGFDTLVEICEYGAVESINADNVLQYLTSNQRLTAENRSSQSPLTRACMQFIMENMKTVTASESFNDQLTNNPTLIIPILRKAAESVTEKKGRKRKISESK